MWERVELVFRALGVGVGLLALAVVMVMTFDLYAAWKEREEVGGPAPRSSILRGGQRRERDR